MPIALIAAIIALYLIQSAIYEKNLLDSIRYDVTLSQEEVFAGDFIYLYENISNDRGVAIPYARVDTELPDGMGFVLSGKGGSTYQEGYIQSVFTLDGHSTVSRRWRVCCKTRGEYHPGSVLLVTNNLLGLKSASKRYVVPISKQNRLVVLPRTVDLDSTFRSSCQLPGEAALPRGLFTDPLLRRGSREYTSNDPMNRINWKSTAARGHLMVNEEEVTCSASFHILINMQSRDFEKNPKIPSVPYYIEDNITVAASLLARIAEYDTPTALIANAFPADYQRADGENLLYSPAYRGQGDVIEGLRLLARLQLEITVPLEKMLDEVLAKPYYYAPDGNLIFVSSFFNQRMLIFHDRMRRHGIEVTFYLTTSQRTVDIPDDVEVFTVYNGKGGFS
ncbi:MAG: DUF58 domain-containing protein [Eubacteriales bacterium]